ncbi:Fic family protein [Sorangium sp. So ce315]|uniref:Fic family protein n=1 Tax=Sorangium sp. So ce315 TaxID=3133299 RepID=UPI003F60D3F7
MADGRPPGRGGRSGGQRAARRPGSEPFLDDEALPPLIHAGLAHAQFETIHPFLDGNGRVGRLLITFLPCQRGVLSRPRLYISHFLKQNRAEYDDRLQAVRTNGAWEEWLTFFIRGRRAVGTSALHVVLHGEKRGERPPLQSNTSPVLRGTCRDDCSPLERFPARAQRR